MPTVTTGGAPLGDKLNDRLGDRLRRWRRTRATELVQQEAPSPRVDVRVVTDSTAYLPVSVVEKHRIEVIPLHVVVGGQELVEGRD
ncbi:MAG TPA: DegV family protein, partial [Intrasporangium sp.]|nr:DegV family protein [Intrasporangium sp.]